MGKKIRIFIVSVLLIGIIGSGFLFYRSYLAKHQPSATIRITYESLSVYQLPFLLAMQFHFFRQDHLSIELLPCENADEALEQIHQGTADIALVNTSDFIEYKVKHLANPVSFTAFASLTVDSNTYLLAREKGPEKFQWSALQGKTILCSKENILDTAMLKSILAQNNLKPEDITFITNIPEALMLGAYAAGIGDYLLTKEPLASQGEQEGIAQVIALPNQAMAPFPGSICVAGSYLTEHPEATQQFTNALYKALIWIQAHTPEEIYAFHIQTLDNKNQKWQKKMLQRYVQQDIWPHNPVLDPQSFQIPYNILKETKAVPQDLSFDAQEVNTSFAQQAVHSVTYIPEDKLPRKNFFQRMYENIVNIF